MKSCGGVVVLAQKPLSVWLSVSLFVVAVASVLLSNRLSPRPSAPPDTLTELTELLSRKAPALYVVPLVADKPEVGAYICAPTKSQSFQHFPDG
jgi:hypothetical protein